MTNDKQEDISTQRNDRDFEATKEHSKSQKSPKDKIPTDEKKKKESTK